MSRKVNVITTCFNEELNRGSTMERNLQRGIEMLDSFQGLTPDIICFPEVFLKSGNDENYLHSDEFSREAFAALSGKAKELGSYIVAGVHEYIGPNKFNVAWLFGRDGELMGRYCKHHPTADEIKDMGIRPGNEIPVFHTDFGNVGIVICYDIGWPKIWNTLASMGAELVVWLAAYDGGFSLEAYAWLNSYYVISSVRTNHSKIIDKTGRVLASTSRWGGWALRTIDLDREIFHIDNQYGKLLEIQRKLGNKVIIESFSQENIFTLESTDPEWPMKRILEEFGLVTYKEFHQKAEALQDEAR